MIEQAIPTKTYLELFGRAYNLRPRWATVGLEVVPHDEAGAAIIQNFHSWNFPSSRAPETVHKSWGDVLTITRTLSDLPSAAKQPTVLRRKDTVSCPEQHKPGDNSDTTESGKPLTSTPRSRYGSTEQLTCAATQIRIASEQDSARCFSEKAGRLVLTGKHKSMEYSVEGQSNLTL